MRLLCCCFPKRKYALCFIVIQKPIRIADGDMAPRVHYIVNDTGTVTEISSPLHASEVDQVKLLASSVKRASRALSIVQSVTSHLTTRLDTLVTEMNYIHRILITMARQRELNATAVENK